MHFLIFLMMFILWLKFFHRAGVGGRLAEDMGGRTMESCSISLPCGIARIVNSYPWVPTNLIV